MAKWYIAASEHASAIPLQIELVSASVGEVYLTPSGEKPPPYTVWGLVTRNNGVASKTYSNIGRLSPLAQVRRITRLTSNPAVVSLALGLLGPMETPIASPVHTPTFHVWFHATGADIRVCACVRATKRHMTKTMNENNLFMMLICGSEARVCFT